MITHTTILAMAAKNIAHERRPGRPRPPRPAPATEPVDPTTVAARMTMAGHRAGANSVPNTRSVDRAVLDLLDGRGERVDEGIGQLGDLDRVMPHDAESDLRSVERHRDGDGAFRLQARELVGLVHDRRGLGERLVLRGLGAGERHLRLTLAHIGTGPGEHDGAGLRGVFAGLDEEPERRQDDAGARQREHAAPVLDEDAPDDPEVDER